MGRLLIDSGVQAGQSSYNQCPISPHCSFRAEALPAWAGGSSVQITPLIDERESSQTQSALVLGVEQMSGGTVRCLGMVQLQGLCCSGAQSKPCTSAPLSITWI